MLRTQDLFKTNFYQLKPYYGNIGNLNFKIQKKQPEEGDAVFEVITWQGPYNEETTKEEKTMKEFPFEDAQMEKIAAYLNEMA
ncbi:MAG: hypothetical protein IJ744_00505 [Lachnospiraceae bacterium]|nr:hypothetical protein [Lachnospiraceae bacterium]